MDVFAFPSRTDTYGNVVLEALASGVPAVVTNEGGPRFIVRSGETGFVANSLQEFCGSIFQLAMRPELRQNMGAAARAHA
jgi:phosphatidylinositol alpha 1,6-mannosyltransferase